MQFCGAGYPRYDHVSLYLRCNSYFIITCRIQAISLHELANCKRRIGAVVADRPTCRPRLVWHATSATTIKRTPVYINADRKVSTFPLVLLGFNFLNILRTKILYHSKQTTLHRARPEKKETELRAGAEKGCPMEH